ncbi:MAG: cytochrome C [Nitrospinae bacterium CG11_big_fil_rev_8_21_14_0_20_56_8]|nr:MAG: cytochrome C [Nitrospinae bacterium CG11_big_fil_rev_8_21_14_0_20_56_8]
MLLIVVFVLGELSSAWGGGMGPRMRHRMHPRMHHGTGFEGTGVCPQERFTPSAPQGILQTPNPLEPTPDNIEKGRAFFQTDAQPTACKVCHGPGGNGMGMMAPGLNPPPRNFTCVETMKAVSDGQMFWIIKNGGEGTGMPAYKFHKDEEIWQIIQYIRSLSPAAKPEGGAAQDRP